jgi:HlyD family secretion protein
VATSQHRIWLWTAASAALLVGLAFAFWPRPILVDLARVTRGPLRVTLDEEAKTRVHDVFVLSAPVAGQARRIESHVGDLVVGGETIVAEIEPLDPEFLDVRSASEARATIQASEAARDLAAAELEKEQAERDFARTELDRIRGLYQRGATSERDLDAAERDFRTRAAAVGTAKAALQRQSFELDRARARLLSPAGTRSKDDSCDDCVPIRAPVSGRILRVLHESEGVVRAGEPLIEIGDPRDLEIVVDLLSEDAVRTEAGQAVLIDDWGGGAVLSGRVRRIEPYGFTKISALGIEEQRVNVIIDLIDPPERWRRLGHGYRVEARIVLWEDPAALKVPYTALFRDGEQWAVFVEADGRAQQRQVQLGRHNGLEAEIRDGLQEGEEVVLYLSDRILDGMRIKARDR